MTDRSYLFVPGDRPERFEKALQSGAHAVILDLEDAVLPAQKQSAREQVALWLHGARQPVYIRVNAAGTPWYAEDLTLLRCLNLRGVMLPKAESAQDLQQIAKHLQPEQTLLPLIETVEGWFQLAELAAVPRVERLAFGSFDFMVDSGIETDGAELDVVRTHLVLHSRRAGLLPPIDGVSLAIHDSEKLAAETMRSRRAGFGAKLCIHPQQIGPVHAAFAPTEAEICWAQKVIDALAQGSAGAVAVDGKLVDKPIALRAQRILQAVKQTGMSSSVM